MAGNFKREDLRIIKTRMACVNALVAFLSRRGFNKITVYDICGEALVSRAAFYAHFSDKYALTRYWLSGEKNKMLEAIKKDEGETPDHIINEFIADHREAMTNLIREADAELSVILSDFFSFMAEAPHEAKDSGRKDVIHDNMRLFCAGGMMAVLGRQAERRFPEGFETAVSCASDMARAVLEFYSRSAD